MSKSDAQFFDKEKSEVCSSATDEITQENGLDSLKSRAIREKQLYPERVNNMRMQFAWAAVILAFLWIFIILYILICHGIGILHLYLFKCIAFGLLTSLITSALIYSLCMCIYSHHQYRINTITKREHLADLWRNLASHISFLASTVLGVIAFFTVYYSIGKQNSYHFIHLTDGVLITLITSTTVSVLGILGAVMWWLFPREKQNQ